MKNFEESLPYLMACALMLVVLILALAVLKVSVAQIRIEATLLSQGVGANSVRCVLDKDAASCALATQETIASPIPQSDSVGTATLD